MLTDSSSALGIQPFIPVFAFAWEFLVLGSHMTESSIFTPGELHPSEVSLHDFLDAAFVSYPAYHGNNSFLPSICFNGLLWCGVPKEM